MGVGGLLDLFIVPGGLGVVGPNDHVGQQVVLVGVPVDGAVDHGHGLGPGDVLLGPESPIGIPIHDAGVGGLVDVVRSPVAGNVGEEILPLIGRLEEASGDGGELGPGDVPVGLEGAVLVAVQDPGIGQGGDGVVVPGVGIHVGVIVGLAPEFIPALVGEEAEEDGSHLGPGDIALRPDGSVGIAHDVGVMVLGVQLGLVTGIHRGRSRIVGIRVRVHHRRVGAFVLLVHQHEGGEAVGGEGQVVAIFPYLEDLRVAQVTGIRCSGTIHTSIVYHMELSVGIGVFGHGPVDGQIVIVAHGDHGVAVVGVHQVQIEGLGLGISDTRDLADGVGFHLLIEVLVVGHSVHQQANAAGVHGYLAVVDVVVYAVVIHSGKSAVGNVIAAGSNGVGGNIVEICHALDCEVAGADLDVAGDRVRSSGLICYGEHSLNLILLQLAGVDGDGVGGRNGVSGHTDLVVLNRILGSGIQVHDADRNLIAFVVLGRVQGVDILRCLSFGVCVVDPHIGHGPLTLLRILVVGKVQKRRQVFCAVRVDTLLL